jgi:hypothetical protein
LTVRATPQLSTFMTASQVFASRVQNAVSVSGAQCEGASICELCTDSHAATTTIQTIALMPGILTPRAPACAIGDTLT